MMMLMSEAHLTIVENGAGRRIIAAVLEVMLLVKVVLVVLETILETLVVL